MRHQRRRFAPPYKPTPAQIAAACRQIRLKWSDTETKKRAGFMVDRNGNFPTWTPPEIDTEVLRDALDEVD